MYQNSTQHNSTRLSVLHTTIPFKIDLNSLLQDKVIQLQRQLEEARLKQQQLEQQFRQVEEERQQLKAFIGSVIHEVRNPLNVAMGYNSFILQERAGVLSGTQKEFAASVAASLQQAWLLTEDLLCQGQLEAGQFDLEIAPLELNTMLRQALQQLRVIAEASGVLLESSALEEENSAAWAMGSEQRVKQCLYNLILNAIKFSPRRGTIRVRVEEQGAGFVVKVEDQGSGIPEDKQHQIFERAYQVKDKEGHHHKGYGLGLSITAELIKRQGGKIGVESQPGKGSCFWFSLPGISDLECTGD